MIYLEVIEETQGHDQGSKISYDMNQYSENKVSLL